ncbi:MAG: helix-turn-helix transcriptional regulator [Cyanobacteria bacterium J06576_12]
MPSNTETLQTLMQAANLTSYRAIAQKADLSRWQIQQLRTGNITKMRIEALTKLSAALEISLTTLLDHFLPQPPTPNSQKVVNENSLSSDSELQQAALQTLETWLTQWPTIAKRAQENPNLSAIKLLPFIRPVEQLMTEWNVAPIAPIDEQLPYNPTLHQLTKGTATPGDLVQVTHTGQTYDGKLLHRAKVKPV